LTAHLANHDEQAADVERTCSAAVEGRRAVRMLAKWCEQFHLSEPEFQVLWLLRCGDCGFDQTRLARQLAYSPAQVSATVERLQARGWIVQEPAASDRRRHLWRLTASGGGVIQQLLSAARELFGEPTANPREAAA
jgi:DNA-binding MarR family transcriptional regulator